MRVSFTLADDVIVTSDLSINEIAQTLGRTKKSIVARRCNLRRAQKREAAGGSGISYDGPTSAEDRHLETIRSGYSRGHTLRRIAADTGLCVATVRRIVNARCTDIAPTRERRQIHIPDANVHLSLVAIVRQMYVDGCTYTEIAQALGLASRSAVAGLVNRHCPDLVGTRQPGRKTPEQLDQIRNSAASRPAPAPRPVVLKAVPASKPKPVVIVATASDPVLFVAATGCRWPLWEPSASLDDKRVCGASCGRHTYCQTHVRLAYRTEERRAA